MPKLIEAMAMIANVFDRYSGKDGKPGMSRAEVAELLRVEFSAGTGKDDIDKFFSALDNDGDGVVDFTEFVTLVAALSAMMKQ